MDNLPEETQNPPLEPQISQPNHEIYGDEYPVVWYEPNPDSIGKKILRAVVNENKTLHLFSNFEETLQFVDSLGISFLLVAPKEIEEQKILKDFGALKDTFGRRLSDIEEESVLRGVHNKISNEEMESFKVYSFFTREDFQNEIPFDEDEEEATVMCDVKEMSKTFREEFAVIWCDPEMTSEMKQTIMIELDIEEKNIYKNFEDLMQRIENETDLPNHLILSGKGQGKIIVSKVNELKNLICIYLYNTSIKIDQKKQPKIIAQKEFVKLLPEVKEGIRTKSKYTHAFPAFATDFDNWDKSHINKVHYYLKGLINFQNRNQAKGDFHSLARNIYQSKKLFDFEKEYSLYNREQILRWYTEESPVYKLINNCLRVSTLDSILYCRFLLKDLEMAIREEYKQETEKFNGLVFRGAYISDDEFEKLERNIGKEIEMYGFLSTTQNKKTAIKFLNADISKKILITIIVPPLPDPELDEQGFADVTRFSKYPDEKEILFNVRSRFQVLEIGKGKIDETDPKSQEYRHLVLFYGTQLLRRFMTIKKPSITFEVEVTGELKCNYCNSEDNLFALKGENTQIACKECFTNGCIPKCTFLLAIDKNEQGNKKIIFGGEILKFSQANKITDYYGYKCDECLKQGKDLYYKWIKNQGENAVIIQCGGCFKNMKENQSGSILVSEESPYMLWESTQNKWEEAGSSLQTAAVEELKKFGEVETLLATQEYAKCKELWRKVFKDVARKRQREQMKLRYFKMIGEGSAHLGDYKEALKYNMESLNILKFIHGEKHPDIANSFNSLTEICYTLGKYQEAIDFSMKSLNISTSISEEKDASTAIPLNNLSAIYSNLGKYQKAFEFSLKSLNVTKSFYGEAHPSTAISFNNLASMSLTLRKHEEALEYNMKSLDIRKSIFGENHIHTAYSYGNLALLYNDLGKYEKALEYNMKSLNITKSIYGDVNPQTATSFNNLAFFYHGLGKYQEALESYMKSLDIRKSVYGEIHPDTARSFNNVASVFSSLGKHQEALEYHMKSLNIIKSIYGETHPDTATSLNNIALVYDNLGKYQEALELNRQSLNIRKSVYGEEHSETATSYDNLASVYHRFGKYQKALKLHTKALDLRKSIYGEIHPDTATSFNNISLINISLGKYKDAIEFSMKSLNITKSAYGETHPDIAATFNHLATIYFRLGKVQQAFEYQMKSLNLIKDIYGEAHPSTATSYSNLAFMHNSLGKYQEASESFLKSLDIQKSIFGEKHPQIASSYGDIASVYYGSGQFKSALGYALKALDLRKSIYGEDHPDTATAYSKLAKVFYALEKYQKAAEYHEKALNIRRSLYGEEHPDTLESYKDLALGFQSI